MDIPSNIKLELEVTTDGLPNLIKNPDGDLGAWGYETPVANTTLTGGAQLTFKTSVSQAAYFRSELVPAIPGKYYQARIDVLSLTASHSYRMQLSWYDATRTYMSSTVQTAAYTATGTAFVGPFVAPAGAAFVLVRVDLYSGTGTANPAANASLAFHQAMMTYQDTATAVQVRRNLLTNPSLETNLSGYTSDLKCVTHWTDGEVTTDGPDSPVRDTAVAYVGTYNVKVTPPAWTDLSKFTSIRSKTWSGNLLKVTNGGANIAVDKNATYTLSAYVQKGTTSRVLRFAAVFGDGTSKQGDDVTIGDGWSRISLTFNTGNHNSIDHFNFWAANNDAYNNREPWYFDAFMLEKKNAAGTYFDGSHSPAGFSAVWDGTANASTSTATTPAGTFDYADPYQFINITDPSAHINVTRDELDTGLLSATLYDPTLDPAIYPELRTGKRLKASAYDGSEWLSLFDGWISEVTSTYDPQGKLKPEIAISASDNVSVLGNLGENRIVAHVADLPFVLEGKGVPWNVNGVTGQIASAAVLGYNENASVLDQIVITRDSNHAYAWVDREGILQVWDSPSTPEPLHLSDQPGSMSYSNIDATFSSADVINQVNVTFLRYNAGTGQTEEVAYGPYLDSNSIAKWGARSKDFTIILPVESESAIATFANAVLAANANPSPKVNSLTVPVVKQSDVRPVVVNDLYSTVYVTYDDKFADAPLRITQVEHDITPQAWNVTYTFQDTGSVASPVQVPSTGFSGTTNATPGVIIANGMVIQSGTVTVWPDSASTAAYQDVTFPVPFAAAPVVTATLKDTTIHFASVTLITPTTVRIWARNYDNAEISNNQTVMWIAMGPA